jgi:hypothetical protein
LKALKQAGIVQGTIDGPRSCYCLNQDTLQRASEAFSTLFADIINPTSCCD